MTQAPILQREPEGAQTPSGFHGRHPVLVYLLGDMVRGFYLVGCLALDLFTPIQLRMSFSGVDAILFASIGAVSVLLYVEFRVYRWIWPPGRARNRGRLLNQRDM